jgi:hypothetical protein
MIMLAYINKIAQLEFEQRARELDSSIQFQEHKTCNDQQERRVFKLGKTIQRLLTMIA